MTKDLFIVVLAALTVMSGVAMLVMFFRRRRERAEARVREEHEDVALLPITSVSHDSPPDAGRRRIDDYAIPVELDGVDEDDDLGKICPSCGKRYRSHHRFCERDDSELAALN